MHGCPGDEQLSSRREALDIADIIRVHGPELRALYRLTTEQTAALRDIERCRTAVLGGHLDVCSHCGFSKPSYNSCRNRHCPKCQSLRQTAWVESRVARTLSTHHTWARDLSLHPHVHCIVTGGGLTQDGSQWKSARRDFLFPVAVMRTLFKGKLLDAITKANAQGELNRPDGSPWLGQAELRTLMRKLHRLKWVVYCKRPFGGPEPEWTKRSEVQGGARARPQVAHSEQVIRYLGRYTHRVAISNNRLVSIDDRGVTLRTRDGNTATLEPVEFLRRFVAHVLPPRFVKIRHFGLMATGKAKERWQMAAKLLGPASAPSEVQGNTPEPSTKTNDDWQSLLLKLTGLDMRRCPQCGQMTMTREPLPDTRAPPIAEAA